MPADFVCIAEENTLKCNIQEEIPQRKEYDYSDEGVRKGSILRRY